MTTETKLYIYVNSDKITEFETIMKDQDSDTEAIKTGECMTNSDSSYTNLGSKVCINADLGNEYEARGLQSTKDDCESKTGKDFKCIIPSKLTSPTFNITVSGTTNTAQPKTTLSFDTTESGTDATWATISGSDWSTCYSDSKLLFR